MKSSDPLFDAVESFFVDYLKLARGCSACTLRSYRDTLRLLFEYAARVRSLAVDRLRIVEFDAELILNFLNHLEAERHNRVSTRNCRRAALRSFFAHLLRRHPEHAGRLARIIALPPKRHPPAPPRYLDPPDVQLLLRHPDRNTPVGRRDYALILFLYNTGARVSEATALRFMAKTCCLARLCICGGRGKKNACLHCGRKPWRRSRHYFRLQRSFPNDLYSGTFVAEGSLDTASITSSPTTAQRFIRLIRDFQQKYGRTSCAIPARFRCSKPEWIL
jgi:site-specific recombinase XerD